MPSQQDDLMRVTAEFIDNHGQQIQNVFNFKITNASEQTDAKLRVAAGEIMELVYANINSSLSEEMTYNVINLFIYRGSQSLGDQAWPTATIGGATGDVLPAGVSALGSAISGVARRVGRKYFGVFSESVVDDGNWQAATVTAVGDAMTDAFTLFIASNGVGLIGVIRDAVTGLALEAISVTASGIPAYQRRRREGVGI